MSDLALTVSTVNPSLRLRGMNWPDPHVFSLFF
jgi:hypothetical protein